MEHRFASWFYSDKEMATSLRTADEKFMEQKEKAAKKRKQQELDDDESNSGDELTEKELFSFARRAVDMFDIIDVDNIGKIDLEELRTILTRLSGQTVSIADMKKAMDEADENKNGSLEEHEFVVWYCSNMKQAAKLRDLDSNRTGTFEVKLQSAVDVFNLVSEDGKDVSKDQLRMVLVLLTGRSLKADQVKNVTKEAFTGSDKKQRSVLEQYQFVSWFFSEQKFATEYRKDGHEERTGFECRMLDQFHTVDSFGRHRITTAQLRTLIRNVTKVRIDEVGSLRVMREALADDDQDNGTFALSSHPCKHHGTRPASRAVAHRPVAIQDFAETGI